MFGQPPAWNRDDGGFTLIEVLVSIVIVIIGIGAVFGLVSISDDTLQKSSAKSELTDIGNDIIETIHSDQANLSEYVINSIQNCSNISTSTGKVDQLASLQRWCAQLEGATGKFTSGDVREIRMTSLDLKEGKYKVLVVELTSNQGEISF